MTLPFRFTVSLGAALLLAIGMVLAGGLIGHGLYTGRAAEHYVTVKGVAERNVSADTAYWPLRFVVAGNDLNKTKQHLMTDQEAIMAFLTLHGIAKKQIEVQRLRVEDAAAQQYRSQPAPNRYVLTMTLMVRSEQPQKVAAAARAVSELVDAGVVLQGNNGPSYLFSGLNDLKPTMIAEATAQARKAAEQFANDANTSLAGIRRANQGVFQILPREPIPGMSGDQQLYKTVRVVSTLQFLLDK